jgi:redox-sensitive bicupin YhaK (pirin superfamily)
VPPQAASVASENQEALRMASPHRNPRAVICHCDLLVLREEAHGGDEFLGQECQIPETDLCVQVDCDARQPDLRISPMSEAILRVFPLGFPWQTLDPFLFCVHHDDAYPAGNDDMGPRASLAGRDIGQDFAGKDGWRMYHGDTVPGFPGHPHRGFETVTIVRRGLIDHSDSLGAAARFGRGDVQWLTAGKGIVHSEMFPLLDKEGGNPLELFQIWLNLPRASKMVNPYFSMLWDHAIPRHVATDDAGRTTEVTVVAGNLGSASPPSPPPDSWASRADADVAIWSIRMAPGATWVLPPAQPGTNRALYFFRGATLQAGGRTLEAHAGMQLRPDAGLALVAGADGAELLLLQGRPIGEPVVQYGPFVMNTPAEIQQAFLDYRRTQFGGWPWATDDPVHGRDEPRFARHADGRVERITEETGGGQAQTVAAGASSSSSKMPLGSSAGSV